LSDFDLNTCFTNFKTDVSGINLPNKFTFPFYYQPHELAVLAAKELQILIQEKTWNHNFDTNLLEQKAVGKMFGVLVVKNTKGELGYLSAFSGKMGDQVALNGFVPPIFNRLETDGYYLIGEEELNQVNRTVWTLEKDDIFKSWKDLLLKETEYSVVVISSEKQIVKENKNLRKEIRDNQESTPELIENLGQESIHDQLKFKRLKRFWKARLAFIQGQSDEFQNEIDRLKKQRKAMSIALQKKLFSDYKFLDANNEFETLWNIFKDTPTQIPPSGAGDCCAPKLLQFAYQQKFEPIALAEFWWGVSPNSIIRKHNYFYPACRGKCEPILGHMLKGLDVDLNPMLSKPDTIGDIEELFQDAHILVINKPAELLSIPGKNIKDSVLTRLEAKYLNQFRPLLLHRLDMSTSGIMIFAKSKRAQKHLQKQFLSRTLKKRYIALLDGELQDQEGSIDLPLRVDLDNRPYQMVCYEHGKASLTEYKVISVKEGKTLIHFHPITGRTHQLRVHASHELGLNISIVGDDLYGKKLNRLHLHAEKIQFTHPVNQEELTFEVQADFI
tara:strand:- start:7269 stop:8939 length:1671 start_codon:yes stop_codon:yes gene_type:complete